MQSQEQATGEVAEHDPVVAGFRAEWFGHIELTAHCRRDPAARD
ncbi:hypothetical protein [Candidatus Poriferisocius sp.]